MQQRSLAASLVAHKKCITRALQRDVCSAYGGMSCAGAELIFFVVGFKVTRCYLLYDYFPWRNLCRNREALDAIYYSSPARLAASSAGAQGDSISKFLSTVPLLRW